MRCPVCATGSRPLGVPTQARLRVCGECGHRFVDCDRFVPEEAYHAGYDGFRPDTAFERNLVRLLSERVRPLVKPSARLLDVGCGNGAGLRAARALGFEAGGIDVSDAAVAKCRDAGLDAVVGDFPTHDFGEQRFDVVTFWDVLEHLPDPARFVERAAALLRPRGLLVAKVPGHRGLSVRVVSWFPRLGGAVLQIPHHLQLFSRESLARLLRPSFDAPLMLAPGALREPSSGGPMRRRAARVAVRAIHRLSGDGGVLAIAHRR